MALRWNAADRPMTLAEDGSLYAVQTVQAAYDDPFSTAFAAAAD